MADELPQDAMTNDGRGNPGGQVNVQFRENKLETVYSNFARLAGTHEEICVDFGVNMQSGENPTMAVIDLNTRVVMSFYSAKRLALQLSHAVQRYEQVYGPLHLDPRQRQVRQSQ